MKNKLNIKTVNFGCDHCSKNSGHNSELDSDDYCGDHPFPYKSGWIYIYNLKLISFEGKVKLKDAHFCSEGCFLNFIIKKLRGAKNEEK